jgi:phosphonate transport system substrate-binding protein
MDFSKKRVIYYTFIFLVSLTTSSVYAADAAVKPIRFGSVAMDIPSVMHKRLTPLTRYLSKALKRPVILTLSPNMKAAIENVATGRVDLAYLTPVAYLRSNEKGNTRLIVKTITKGKASFQLMIVTREDSNIKAPGDLRNKTFAFGDKAALLQRAVVVGAGVPLNTLGKYGFLSHYDNVVRAVLNRDYDAGILKDTKAFKWENKGIKIIHRSPHLPPYNITARDKMDQKLFLQIQKAFLDLRISNPSHKSVIRALSSKYTGFAITNDNEYDVVRKLTAPFTK